MVDAVGIGVTGFSPGMLVVGHVSGAFAEQTIDCPSKGVAHTSRSRLTLHLENFHIKSFLLPCFLKTKGGHSLVQKYLAL